MLFADMQNAVLAKGRLLGLNWGNNPTNTGTSFNPPYQVALYLNIAYNTFLSRISAYPLSVLQVSFPTQANVNSYPLQPVPPNGTTINPSALRVYEFVYQTAQAQSRRVEQFSTARFRAATNQYQNRFGSYSSWPLFWTQLFGRPAIDIWPGNATVQDTIYLTICPDPMNSPSTVSAAAGGALVHASDIPLVPAQFHMALVYWTVAEFCDAANKPEQQQANLAAYEKLVQEALMFGAAFGEGDPEQYVLSPWTDAGL